MIVIPRTRKLRTGRSLPLVQDWGHFPAQVYDYIVRTYYPISPEEEAEDPENARLFRAAHQLAQLFRQKAENKPKKEEKSA